MKTEADAKALWDKILTTISSSPQEVCTIDSKGSNSEGKWFKVETDNNNLRIYEAEKHKPSSDLAVSRPVYEKEFISLYQNYYKWRAGTMPRTKAKGNSKNSSYIFALINQFETQQ